MKIPRHFPFLMFFLAAFSTVITGTAQADTIVFESGVIWKGKKHKENFYFPDRRTDPNLIEFEKLEGNTIVCYGLDLKTQGSLIKEIIEDDYEFPTGATYEERLRKAREAYEQEVAMRMALATPTPSAEVELQVTALLAKGWALRKDAGQDVKLVGGLKIPVGSELVTRMNSRLKLQIGEALFAGVEQDSHLSVEKSVWDQVRRHYLVSLPMKKGRVWFQKKTAAHDIAMAEILMEPVRISASNSIFRVTKTESNLWRVAVFESESFSLQFKDRKIEVAPGQEVTVDSTGNVTGTKQVTREQLQVWTDWDLWEPLEVTLETAFADPPLAPAPLAGFQYALPSLGVADRGFAGSEPRAMTLADTLTAYRQGITAYHKDTGLYPSESQGLSALRADPGVNNWKGPYISVSLGILDPWDKPFIYKIRKLADGAQKPDVYSAGPNGEDDNRLGDDVY